LIQFLDEKTKTYVARVSLGTATDTGDPTGEVTDTQAVPPLTEVALKEALAGFLGDRMQRPPAYSAVKVKGKRLYKYAREGKAVQAEPRPICIERMDLVNFSETTIDLIITCSRGTYVRVLAEEIGVALGTVGHLGALQRSRSGPFEIADAIGFPEISKMVADSDDWPKVLRPPRGEERVPWAPRDEVWAKLEGWLRPPAAVLGHLPAVSLSSGQKDLLQRRGTPPAAPEGLAEGALFTACYESDLVAVLRRESGGTKIARMFAIG
jgi:tRNA pseudouridine(55) synthase